MTLQEIRALLQKPLKQPSLVGNFAANAKLTTNIPTNGTHYMLLLRCLTGAGVELTRAQILADVGTIILRINGKQIWEGTAEFFLDRQKYYGDCYGTAAGNVDGYIPLFFYLPHLESDPERRVMGWGMQNVNSFEVEVNLLGAAQLASMEAYSVVSDEVRPFGRHLRIRRSPQNFPTTGEQEIVTLARENGNCDYLALHIEAGNGTFQDVTVIVNNVIIHDHVPPGMNKVMLAAHQRTPQTGYYHVDFGRRNDLSSILPMAGVTDFRVKPYWITAAPDNYDIYAELLFNDLSS